MKLIGLTGRKQSGKSTVANYLEEEYGYIQWSFADPIKQMVSRLLTDSYHGTDDFQDDWENGEWKETVIPWLGVTPRLLAQTLGTEWGRDTINENVWINKAEQDISSFVERCPQHAGRIVVSDVRFQNEAKWIRQQDGVIIELHRGSINAKDEHASEQGVRENMVNHIIFNNKSLERLYATVDDIMKSLHVEKIRSRSPDS